MLVGRTIDIVDDLRQATEVEGTAVVLAVRPSSG
jgi:hypothetical protein